MEGWVVAGVMTPRPLLISSVKYWTADFSHFSRLLVSVFVFDLDFIRLVEGVFFLHSESCRVLASCSCQEVLGRQPPSCNALLQQLGALCWRRDSPCEKSVSHKNDFKSLIFSASAALHQLRIGRRVRDAGEKWILSELDDCGRPRGELGCDGIKYEQALREVETSRVPNPKFICRSFIFSTKIAVNLLLFCLTPPSPVRHFSPDWSFGYHSQELSFTSMKIQRWVLQKITQCDFPQFTTALTPLCVRLCSPSHYRPPSYRCDLKLQKTP